MPKKYDFAGQMDEGEADANAVPSFEDVYGIDLPDQSELTAIVQQRGTAVAIGDFSVSRVGLQFLGDVDHTQWLAFFEALRSIQSAMQWIVGDWLNYGIERKWGETYDEFSEITGLKVKTLQEYAYVSRQVDFSIRMEEVSFGHHQLVSGMEEEEQQHWLTIAADNKFTRAQLREAIWGEDEERDDVGLNVQRRRMTKIVRFMAKSRIGELSNREREKALGEIAAARRWLDETEQEVRGGT